MEKRKAFSSSYGSKHSNIVTERLKRDERVRNIDRQQAKVKREMLEMKKKNARLDQEKKALQESLPSEQLLSALQEKNRYLKEGITRPERDSKIKTGDAGEELEQRFAEFKQRFEENEQRFLSIEQRFVELDRITETKNDLNAQINLQLMKNSNEMEKTLSNMAANFEVLRSILHSRTV